MLAILEARQGGRAGAASSYQEPDGAGVRRRPAALATAGVVRPPSRSARRRPAAPALQIRPFAGGVTSGLEAPVHVAAPRERARALYVVEQRGRDPRGRERQVRRPSSTSASGSRPAASRGCSGSHSTRNYARNRCFYVNYTDRRGHERRRVPLERPARDPRRRARAVRIDQPYPNHNGGLLAFGPDGCCTSAWATAAPAAIPRTRPEPGGPLGKMLRIDVAGRDAPEIVGARPAQPVALLVRPATGDLYIGDVGQGAWRRSTTGRAAARGSRTTAGTSTRARAGYEDKTPGPGELVVPGLEYPTTRAARSPAATSTAARGPAARGRYFYGDYCSGIVWSLSVGGRQASAAGEPFAVANLTSFGEDAPASCTSSSHGGTIYRLAARYAAQAAPDATTGRARRRRARSATRAGRGARARRGEALWRSAPVDRSSSRRSCRDDREARRTGEQDVVRVHASDSTRTASRRAGYATSDRRRARALRQPDERSRSPASSIATPTLTPSWRLATRASCSGASVKTPIRTPEPRARSAALVPLAAQVDRRVILGEALERSRQSPHPGASSASAAAPRSAGSATGSIAEHAAARLSQAARAAACRRSRRGRSQAGAWPSRAARRPRLRARGRRPTATPPCRSHVERRPEPSRDERLVQLVLTA